MCCSGDKRGYPFLPFFFFASASLVSFPSPFSFIQLCFDFLAVWKYIDYQCYISYSFFFSFLAEKKKGERKRRQCGTL